LFFKESIFLDNSILSSNVTPEPILESEAMPFVLLKYKSCRIPDEYLKKLTIHLTTVIATVLDIPENPEARVTPEDIHFWVVPSHPLDLNNHDLEFMIFAHPFPERWLGLDDKNRAINMAIELHMLEHKIKAKFCAGINPAFASFCSGEVK